MDKSKEYIQMCKTSKEIQSEWKPKAGDFYTGDHELVHCWAPSSKGADAIKKGFGIRSENNITRLSKLTWLPTLNQLIELSQTDESKFRDTSFLFYEWVRKPYINNLPSEKTFDSQEQLWLVFIMATKFGKKWMENNWVGS